MKNDFQPIESAPSDEVVWLKTRARSFRAMKASNPNFDGKTGDPYIWTACDQSEAPPEWPDGTFDGENNPPLQWAPSLAPNEVDAINQKKVASATD